MCKNGQDQPIAAKHNPLEQTAKAVPTQDVMKMYRRIDWGETPTPNR